MNMKLYQKIASTIQARLNCIEKNNLEWKFKHEETLKELANELPSGSGFDNATDIIWEECSDKKLVLFTQFHHMDDSGMYDGWTEHRIVVKPSLVFGFELSISGRNKNEIKEYMYDMFRECLDMPV